MDIITEVIDEIGLNGLEGTTIPGLWDLLSKKKPAIVNQDDDDMKNFIWNGLCQCDQIEFWWLNKDKKDTLWDDKNLRESDKVEPDNDDDETIPNKKLPVGWISDSENKIFGYCPDYEKRENVTKQIHKDALSLNDVFGIWQEDLYIVGSIELRNGALFGDESPQNLIMTDFRYIFLELIGKTRHDGLLQADFCKYSMDPRSSFHFVKVLIDMGLITKQLYCFRRKESDDRNNAKLIRTNILFLKRFHRLVMSNNEKLEEQVLQELHHAPGQMLELRDLRKRMNCSAKALLSLKRNLFKSGKVQFIESGRLFTFRDGIGAIPKSPCAFIQLAKPIGKDSLMEDENTDDDDGDDDDDDDDDDDNVHYLLKCKYTNPQLLPGIPKLHQMYWIIDSFKDRGVTIRGLGTLLCLPCRMARNVIRLFCKRKLIKGVVTTKSRQRVICFITNNYIYQSTAFKEINAEFDKAEDLEQTEAKDLTEKVRETAALENVSTDAEKQDDQKGKSADTNVSERGQKIFCVGTSVLHKRKGSDQSTKMVETSRAMRRQNALLEKIKETKVIEGANPLYKFILQSEKDFGVKEKVCRKSIVRLLERMAKAELIKKFEVLIPHGDETPVSISYYCEANISMDDETFKNALSQTKFRLKGIFEKRLLRWSKQVKPSEEAETKTNNSHNVSLLDFVNENEDANNEQTDTEDEEYEPITGSSYQRQQYGYMPRFPRIQILHVYLWQLVYGTKEDAALCTGASAQQPEEDTADFRPEHYGWLNHVKQFPVGTFSKGEFQVGDALAIMPLEIFIKCVGICLRSKTIERLLIHPEKRYTPLRDLPPRLKQKLFRGKLSANYNGHFSESLVLMAHMGLLRVSPEKLPANRTQIVMCVSRDAKLVDTTQSEKGYSQVKLPQGLSSFPELTFKFNGLRDISRYWRDLQCICLNTRLGLLRNRRRKGLEANKCEGDPKSFRPSRMFLSLKEIQEEYKVLDPTASLPRIYGNGLGAAGFDSAFFGHLPKNWSNPDSRRKHLLLMNQRVSSLGSEQRIPPPLGGFTKRVANSVVTKALVGGRVRKRKRVFDNKILCEAGPSKRGKDDGILAGKSGASDVDCEKLKKLLAGRHHQKLAKSRIIGKKEKNKGHRATVDEIDLAAIKRKRTMRVKFCSNEDTAILIARVAATLLGIDEKTVRYWSAIRNNLHKMYPESRDKTTESLVRRARTLFKDQLTIQNFRSCLLECKTDPNLVVPKITSSDDWKPAINELFPVVLARFQTRLDIFAPDEKALPETLQELKEKFRVRLSLESNDTRQIHRAPTEKEIMLCSTEQLIHNSLVSRNSSEYMPSLVFHIFNQFPEAILDDAMLKMKKKGLVTRLRMQVPRRRAVPISTMTFSLSVLYARLFELPLPISLFKEAGIIARLIKDGGNHLACCTLTGNKANEAEKRGDLCEGVKASHNENEEAESNDENCPDFGSKKGQPVEDSTQHCGPTSACTSPLVRPFVYSQKNCVGGHVAGILSLLVTGRASLDMDIPDEMLDVDRLTAEDHTEAEDQRGLGMVTLLKRKIYSQNVEDALLLNDDGNLSSEGVKDDYDEDDEDGDDRGKGNGPIDADDNDDGIEITVDDRDDNSGSDNDDDAVDDDNDDEHDGARVTDFLVDNKPKPESGKVGGATVGCRASSLSEVVRSPMKVQSSLDSDALHSPERSCLQKRSLDSPGVSKGFVPKKRRKVTFSELDLESETSQSSSNDGRILNSALDPYETYRSSDDVSMNVRSCIEESGIPNKQAMHDAKTGSTYSISLTHKVRTNSGNMCFLSRQSYINKFAEKSNKGDEYSKLSLEFSYADDEENTGTRGSLAIVPRRGLDVSKTRLHASRITLLLHRSIDQDSGQLKKHLFKSMENMVLNPIDIAICSTPQPHLNVPMKSHTDLNSDEDEVGSGFSNVDFSKEECEKLDRFMKTEPIAFEKSELNEALSSDDIKGFCKTMIDSFNWNEYEVVFTNEVLDMIIETKQYGLTEEEIGKVYQKYSGLRPLEDIVQMCVNFRLLIRVGIFSRRYVASGFAANWSFVTSLKSLERASERAEKESTETEEKLSNQDGKMEELENEQGEDEDVYNSSSKYQQTVCKPWLKLNGDYNIPLLQKFQRSVLALIMMCPGINESAIYGHFRPVLTKVALVEILEFLEISNCITKHLSNRRNKPRLFDSAEAAINTDFTNGDPHYAPTLECILNNAC